MIWSSSLGPNWVLPTCTSPSVKSEPTSLLDASVPVAEEDVSDACAELFFPPPPPHALRTSSPVSRAAAKRRREGGRCIRGDITSRASEDGAVSRRLYLVAFAAVAGISVGALWSAGTTDPSRVSGQGPGRGGGGLPGVGQAGASLDCAPGWVQSAPLT